MVEKIVAQSRSKWGGKCQSPTHTGPHIQQNDVIFKIANEGKTTQHGQGPGYWICERCAKVLIDG